MKEEVYIVGAKRTALGSFQGVFSSKTAPNLASCAIQAVVEQANRQPKDIDAVYIGNVISAGIGQAPARQAALQAGLLPSTPCTTVSKVCGSGMKAIMQASDTIRLQDNHCVIAGGMESMSNAPYLLPTARQGHRLGHAQTMDSLFVDGLQDAHSGKLMGSFGDAVAKKFTITREAMDDFAITSLQRAQYATQQQYFMEEITPVSVFQRKVEQRVVEDEQIGKAKVDKIPTLKPAFAKEGVITAANASSISDGAAAVLLMSEQGCKQHQQKPIAIIRAYASHAQVPEEFTLAPIGAIKKVLKKAQWSIDDVDLFEINEAFAVVTMLAMRELDIAHERVNVHGGACAIGHPLGASGARIVVTLLYALIRQNKKKGIASLCIGGGEATAIAIERLV